VNAVGRHPNVLIGLLLAIVAVLVVVAVIGLWAPAAPRPNAAGIATPAPAVAGAATAPPAVAVPEAPESPPPIEIAPGVVADCGRIARVACEHAINMARAGNEADLAPTTLIVVDDVCAPEVECDRMFPFDVIVVFVTAGADTTGWYAFHVVGPGDTPTGAERWPDEIPPHIVDRIWAAMDTP
jgi:hypothetical protein